MVPVLEVRKLVDGPCSFQACLHKEDEPRDSTCPLQLAPGTQPREEFGTSHCQASGVGQCWHGYSRMVGERGMRDTEMGGRKEEGPTVGLGNGLPELASEAHMGS